MRKGLSGKYCTGMAFLLGCSILLSGCGGSETAEAETSAVLVDMQQAEVGTLTLSNSFVGSISAQETVYVIPFASGTVTEVNYDVGDYVNAGDVLFQIDDDGAQLQLRQAQLGAASAQQQANMATGSQQKSADLQLESSQVQTTSGFEQAQIAYVQAKDAYETLDDAVDDLKETEEQLESAIAAASVSGGNASDLQNQLATVKTNLTTLRTQRDTAHNAFLQAQSAYNAAKRGQEIFDETKSLTQGEMRADTRAQLDTSLQVAQLGVDSAELALSYYTVTAPISGVIQSRSVEVNGIAGSSSPAFTIANENSMTATFHVSESVRNTLQVGEAITVERGGATYEGHITEIGVAVNPQTGLFQIKANVSADGTKLPGGVSVKITADTYTEENAVLIPYDAVYYDNSGSYVYLCQNGLAVKTYVSTGIFDDTTIAVTEGISEGDTVITSWSPRLLDGVEVTAAEAVNQ